MKSIRNVPLLDSLLGSPEDESLPYVCEDCGTRLAVQHHSCPKCGSFSIERTSWSADA
ncbi:MAG: hypothetical protein ABEJ67_05285 [Halanaeroarchaeum sp.]